MFHDHVLQYYFFYPRFDNYEIFLMFIYIFIHLILNMLYLFNIFHKTHHYTVIALAFFFT